MTENSGPKTSTIDVNKKFIFCPKNGRPPKFRINSFHDKNTPNNL